MTEDGKEIHSEQTGDEVTTRAGRPHRRRGHQGPPGARSRRPRPRAATGGAGPRTGRPGRHGGLGDVWARLAQCESGGNPRAVSANGLYHGLYQFSVQTWQAMGGSGLPSHASPGEQTQRAQALQARSGWGQWPACAKKLGLL